MDCYLGLIHWHTNKILPIHNPGNGSHLWQVAPGKTLIYSLGATSGIQIYESPSQVPPPTALKSSKVFQRVQYSLPKESGR